MCDGLFAAWWPWPYHERLPVHPEPVEEPVDGRVPGLVDESN
jgi:hypothetical protein